MYTEMDWAVSAGLSLGGARWGRPEDTVGLAGNVGGLSEPHRRFLEAGGIGFITGDGRLSYRPELAAEAYYGWRVAPGTDADAPTCRSSATRPTTPIAARSRCWGCGCGPRSEPRRQARRCGAQPARVRRCPTPPISPRHFAPPGPLGFGGAPLGNMFSAVDEATAEASLTAAWDSGIRYFDTAPHYGAGLSEHRFGHVLRQRPREEFVLSTKVGRLQVPDREPPRTVQVFVDALPFRPVYDYSADGTLRSIEDSLQRLGLSHIDIAYIHDIAEDTHGAAWEGLFDQAMDGAARALTRLREEGVIRAWGLGVNLAEPCLRALDRADPDVFLLAGRYSLIDHAALDALFPACAAARRACGGRRAVQFRPARRRPHLRLRRGGAGRRSRRATGWRRSAAGTASISAPRRCNSAPRIRWWPRSSRAPRARRGSGRTPR